MKKHITLLFTILIVLGLCACSFEEIMKPSPVDVVDIVRELSQSLDMIEVDKTVVLDTPELDTEPSTAHDVPTSDTAAEREPFEAAPLSEALQTTPKQTDSPKDTDPQKEQKVSAPSEETISKTEPPAETAKPQEPEPTTPSEPEKPTTPKTAYDYEFNIDQIRQDLIALAKGYGLTLDESLDPNNASWANPVFATKNTQGDLLKRLLNEHVQYYADKDYRAAMGLSDLGLTIFNIYCESLGDGVYGIYFLCY